MDETTNKLVEELSLKALGKSWYDLDVKRNGRLITDVNGTTHAEQIRKDLRQALETAYKKGEESGWKEATIRWVKLVNQDPMKCPECQAPLVPDLERHPYSGPDKDKWDGHTYKASCKCLSPHMRLCKG